MRDNDRTSDRGTAKQTDQALSSALGSSEAFAGFSRLSIGLILTDPRQDDNPIVYVNDAFERTTGYKREAVIGRNCRFLQGEATDKRDVDRIREAVAEAREVSVDILNYRANGTPFVNRVIISPVLDDAGQLLFFLGIHKELVESDRGADNRISTEHLRQIQALVCRDLSVLLASLREPTDDEPASEAAEAGALPRRLEALQFVYEELRHSRRLHNRRVIDLGRLIGRIASATAYHEGRAGVRFVQVTESCEFGLEAATRTALIVAEALQNAFVHAFAGLDEGQVDLRVTRMSGGGVRIIVADDGVGLPPGTAWPGPRTAGGRLVRNLLVGLDATLNVTRGAAGTVVLIDLPVDLNA